MEIFKTVVFFLLCGTIEAKKRSFCNAQTCNKCAKIYIFAPKDSKVTLVRYAAYHIPQIKNEEMCEIPSATI